MAVEFDLEFYLRIDYCVSDVKNELFEILRRNEDLDNYLGLIHTWEFF